MDQCQVVLGHFQAEAVSVSQFPGGMIMAFTVHAELEERELQLFCAFEFVPGDGMVETLEQTLASSEKFCLGADAVDVFFSDSPVPSLRTAGRREGEHPLLLVHRDYSHESLQTPVGTSHIWGRTKALTDCNLRSLI